MPLQIRYQGQWRGLQRLTVRLDAVDDPSGSAGPVACWIAMNYDVITGPESESQGYMTIFATEELPANAVVFNAAEADPSDIANLRNGAWMRILGLGRGRWAIGFRILARLEGDDADVQLKRGLLDGNMYWDGVGFPTSERQSFRLHTREIA